MKDFVFYNPTKIVFGEGSLHRIGELAAPFAKKVLYVYGMSSIKKNGVYDQTTASLRQAGVECVDFGGVKSNPVVSHARQGVLLAKKEKVDAVVAVGGGSVMDEAKAIAAGAKTTVDLWEFFNRSGMTIESALPIFTVVTMAATASEMNNVIVMSNDETHQKLGIRSPHAYPTVSVLDPMTLRSVPPNQTAFGAVDAATHLMESYFTRSDPDTPIQDRYVEGLVKTIVEIAEPMLREPDNLSHRSTFMWAATLAWNGLAPAGVGSWSTPNHLIGHSMSALYDVPHGASLSISLSGWMPWYAEQNKEHAERIAQLGRAVFHVDSIDATIEAFRTWYRSLGCPTTLRDAGLNDADLLRITENIGDNAPLWGLDQYTAETCEAILRRC